ncbi:MAG: sulfate permease [Phototrophicaceae bacterium]
MSSSQTRLQQLKRMLDPDTPILGWMLYYQRAYLTGDILAGLTIAVMLVPQSIAYALLAGLPPVMGLYASILPVMLYGFLGSARVLSLGPTAITSVMTFGTIGILATSTGISLSTLAITLALLLGGVYLIMGILRLGFLVNFLSRPVLVGYINAAAIIIVIGQLQHLLGITVESSALPHMLLWRTLNNLSTFNPVTVLIGVGGIVTLLFIRYGLSPILLRIGIAEEWRFLLSRSGALVLVMVTVGLVFQYDLHLTADVAIIGEIPSGFPALTIGFDFTHWRPLLLGAIAIAFVGFMEDISTAKSLLKGRDQLLKPTQELFAMGVANVASAVTGGMPVTTSVSRSVVNYEAGGKTGLSSIIAGTMLALTVIFLTRFFYYLPRPTLAAIIITSVVGLIDIKTLQKLWGYSRAETGVMLATTISVFFFSIEIGIFIGILLSIIVYIYRTSRTPIVELGRDRQRDFYSDIDDDWTLPIPHVAILRIDESIYFMNAQFLDRYLRNLIAKRQDVRYLVLVCSGVNTLDTSSIQILEAVVKDFHDVGVEVLISEMRARSMLQIKRGDLHTIIGNERFFETTHDAILATGLLPDDVI